MAEQTPGYIFNAFVFTYGTTVLGASRNMLLFGADGQHGARLYVGYGGRWLSDVIGRRKMYIIGCVFVAAFTFVYFAMLDTRVPGLIFLAVALSFIPVMTMYGPEAALIAEAFTPRLRYSGSSLGYQLASIIAGGPAPFISTWLFVDVQLDDPDRHLRLDLRRDQHRCRAAAAGLHQSGNLDRGALQRSLPEPRQGGIGRETRGAEKKGRCT